MPLLKKALTKDPIIQEIFERATTMGLGTGDLEDASKVSATSLVVWKNGAASPRLDKLRDLAAVVGLDITTSQRKAVDRKRAKR